MVAKGDAKGEISVAPLRALTLFRHLRDEIAIHGASIMSSVQAHCIWFLYMPSCLSGLRIELLLRVAGFPPNQPLFNKLDSCAFFFVVLPSHVEEFK